MCPRVTWSNFFLSVRLRYCFYGLSDEFRSTTKSRVGSKNILVQTKVTGKNNIFRLETQIMLVRDQPEPILLSCVKLTRTRTARAGAARTMGCPNRGCPDCPKLDSVNCPEAEFQQLKISCV